MLAVEEALKRIVAGLTPLPPEWVHLGAAHGRVLARDLVASRDQPPHAISAMDGYAVRAADLPAAGTLRCVGEVPAGQVAPRPLAAGEAYRVMTGAPLPAGADAVVMVEQTESDGDRIHFREPARSGQNIHAHAGDLRSGDQPLEIGRRITPATVPLLATLGKRWVQVRRRPEVALLTSGDELVEPEHAPGPGQIRDSNRFMLASQVRAVGAIPRCLPIAPDDPDRLRRAIRDGLASDVLVMTGGASVGDYDYSREVILGTGAALQFDRVAIKPGKPVLYATLEERQIFCLPGNPVSAFVTFELLVRPALLRWQGFEPCWPVTLSLPVTETVRAPKVRDLFLVSKLVPAAGGSGWAIAPIRWHGSGDLVSMADANALLWVAADGAVESGEPGAVIVLGDTGHGLPSVAGAEA
jgi:molybdopterin molybdotransferase